MFTLSARADYGLTAVIELAKHPAGEPLQIRDIAEPNSIPQHYLEQLLVVLRRRGIVRSYRGAKGGYSLTRSPSAIRVLEVLEALDGPLELLPETRSDSPLSFYTRALEKSLRTLLDITVEELLLRKQEDDDHLIYTI
jgi:Rrf2 family transcriptional regulator, cysteine metabolism repressor